MNNGSLKPMNNHFYKETAALKSRCSRQPGLGARGRLKFRIALSATKLGVRVQIIAARPSKRDLWESQTFYTPLLAHRPAMFREQKGSGCFMQARRITCVRTESAICHRRLSGVANQKPEEVTSSWSIESR